jgi:hypothetical protein
MIISLQYAYGNQCTYPLAKSKHELSAPELEGLILEYTKVCPGDHDMNVLNAYASHIRIPWF